MINPLRRWRMRHAITDTELGRRLDALRRPPTETAQQRLDRDQRLRTILGHDPC